MNVVIGGCRDYNDYEAIKINIDKIFKDYTNDKITIISGHCRGVDLCAEKYAIDNNIHLLICAPDWKRYGKAAGPIRNKIMIDQADCVIAFWDGKSKGTKQLISYAGKQKKNELQY